MVLPSLVVITNFVSLKKMAIIMIDHVTQDLDEYLKECEKGINATERAYQEFEHKIPNGNFAIVANDTLTMFKTTQSAVHWLDENYLLDDDSELKNLSQVEKDDLADICEQQGVVFLWTYQQAEEYYINSTLSDYPLDLENTEV